MMDKASPLHPALRDRVRVELLQCDSFQRNATLRVLFADPRLQPWANYVPEALTAVERVDATIALLQHRRHAKGEPALVLLLDAVRERVDLGDAQHMALAELAEEVAANLSGATLEPTPRQRLEKVPGESPFKGLHYYDVEDASNFYGREALVATLLGILQEPDSSSRHVVLVGPSGSGKTSLLRAGIAPALGQQEGWLYYLTTPTAHPLQKLAATLSSESASLRRAAALVDDLQQEPRSLSLQAHQLMGQTGADRLLLVVDHFEELFTLCEDEEARMAFINNLLAASKDGPVTLLIALDSAYVEAVARYDTPRRLLAGQVLSIGRMSEEELQRAIEEPALRGGWEFEAGLVERIMKDVGGEPGTLPLLSQALHATWERREGQTLTHAGYQTAGEVDGAVAQTAEDLFAALREDEQAIARAICLRLVIPRDAGGSHRLPRDARARVPRPELLPTAPGRDAVEEVIKLLVRKHLLIVEGEIVALAQDTLLQEWSRLRQWIEEERPMLRQHYRLALDARHWHEEERDVSLTYRGSTLDRAEAYADAPTIPLSGLETVFLAESRRAQVQRVRLEQERQQQTRRSALGAAVGGAIGTGLTIWAIYRNLIVNAPALLLFTTLIDSLLGAVAGVALVLLVDLALNANAVGDERPTWQSWFLVALAGSAALAFLLVGHTLFTTQRPFTVGKMLLSLVEGGLWGAGVGLGRAWLIRSVRPPWRSLLPLMIAWALTLLLADQIGGAFSYLGDSATGTAVLRAGAIIPLFMLGGAELAASVLFARERPTSAQRSS